MRKIKKHQFEAAAVVLLSLLAFSLLLDSPFTALSLDSRAPTIGSSGSVTYQSSSILLVTDSTPEGPVPYKLDGELGYETGSSYTVEPGTHIIEMPSPYTSPISSITYYFLNWQDGPANNPRDIALQASTSVTFNGIYSTSANTPPEPPLNYTRPTDYLAYTGYEGSTTPTASGVWEDGYLSNAWNNQGNNNWIVTSYYDGGTGKTILPYQGSEMLRKEYNGYDLRNEWQVYPSYTIEHYYQSYWMYIPTTFGLDWAWWVPGFPSLREYSVAGTLLLHLEKPYGGAWSTIEWRFMYGTTPVNNNPRWWDWHIPSTSGSAWELSSAYQYPTASRVQWNNVPIPRGRWFRIEAYIYRHPSNGIVKVWLTDTDANNNPLSRQLVFGIENVRTRRDSFTSPLHSYAQKLYGFGPSPGGNSAVPKTVLYDEVYICDAYPYDD